MFRDLLRRIFRIIFLSRPIVSILRFISPRAHLALRADLEWRPRTATTDLDVARELAEYALRNAKPPERRDLEAWADAWAEADQHTVAYAAHGIFETQQRLIRRHKGDLEGLRILELGPGHTVGPGLLLFAHGARSYAAAD